MKNFEEWTTQFLERDNSVSPDEIHNETKQHFQDLCSSTNKNDEESVNIKTIQKSISSDIALLISKMGELILSESNTPKVKALHCLLGATDGIQIGANDDQNVGMPLKMAKLMGRFYIEHCSPIQPSIMSVIPSSDDDGLISNEPIEDYTVEDVRDAALSCICSLIQNPLIVENEDEEEDGDSSKDQSIQFRISIMKDAVQRRCASAEDEDMMDDDSYYGDENEESTILSGLSLLPRAKRSLCFRALESVLSGIAFDTRCYASQELSLNSKSVELCITFTNFAASCLHGESDPRCLVQMLKLLKRIQSVIPICVDESNNFPFVAIFDAVAPYYPIKFTPPPHDPWGITREGLHNALLEILTYSSHHGTSTSEIMTINQTQGGDDNMTVLATRLFLERISPPSQHPFDDDQDEEPTTVQDRIDALEDLTTLLLLPLDQDSSTIRQKQKQSDILSNLSHEVVEEMSNILLRCHNDAATSAVSATNKEEENDNKTLANLCRNFVTRMSYEFEIQPQSKGQAIGENNGNSKKSHWHCFVLYRVQDLANIISSSPQSVKGRIAIAYVASLSACGGERTLRLCLDSCIPPLLGLLKGSEEGKNNDEEQMSTAAYGIGVFFSSCRLSMEQISKDGIVVHPHPLQVFGSPVIQSLCKITNRNTTGVELKIAAVKALESVLVSSPFAIMDQSDGDLVTQTVLNLSQSLTDDINVQSSHDKVTSEWKLTCARLVGTTIGRAMKEEEKTNSQTEENTKRTIFEEDIEISTFVKESLFPQILIACTQYYQTDENIRYDWEVLAHACAAGDKHVSDLTLCKLFEALKGGIENDEQNEKHIVNVTQAISHILQKGGSYPKIAFHTNGLQIDIVNTLSRPQSQSQQDAEMSTLLLPEIRNKKQIEADNTVRLAFSILPLLLMTYHNATPQDKAESILSLTAQVLPPLSDWDNTRLCVTLPILSIILAGESTVDESLLCSLAPSLIDFILTKENRNAARTAAASCVFSIASKKLKNKNNCIGQQLLRDTVCPLIVRKIESLERNQSHGEDMDELHDALNLTALIGSAIACLGGSSSHIANEVARFLALIACDRTAHSVTLGIATPLDCKINSCNNNSDTVPIIAGNALGFMLGVQNGSPFWRQRISHLILPIVLSQVSTPFSDIEHGRLLCACHLVCCVSLPALGEKRVVNLASLIINGLEKSADVSLSALIDRNAYRNLRTILIASLMKIMNDAPQAAMCHVRTIVPVIVLTLISMNGVDEIPSHLIALQILTNIVTGVFSDRNTAAFCQMYRDTVVMHLSQLIDHPSLQIRQAAAKTRNTWFVMNHN